MSILVTGAAGFIGSNLVDELLVQGHEVVGLDDLSEGKLDNLQRWKGHERFQFVRGSILDRDLLKRTITEEVSSVAHLAADSRIQTGITDPLHSIETNVVGTANVAEACRQVGVKRIVYAASSSAYGRKNDWVFGKMPPSSVLGDVISKGLEIAFEDVKGLSEDMPTDCLNPYSMSKKAGEDVMDVYHRLYGVSTCALRLFNVYGPRHQEEGRYATVIAIFRRQLRQGQKMTIVGDGKQRRDFTFVGDVVRAFMLALHNREATGVFNIGTGTNHSINELAEMCWGRCHRDNSLEELVEHIPPRLGEAVVTLADNRKAGMVLGWKPQVDLAAGLEVIDAYERKFPPHKLVVS